MSTLRLLFVCAIFFTGAAVGHPGQHQQLQRATEDIESQPRAQELYIRRGAIYSASGKFVEARRDFTMAEQLGPPVLVAFERGMDHYRNNEYLIAVSYFDRYIRRFPATPAAYEHRARAALGAGNHAAAISDYRHYFELNARPHPGSYLAAARLLGETGYEEEALALLDSAMARLGTTPQLQRPAISLELQLGRVGFAIERQRSLEIALLGNPRWKLEMAELLALDGHTAEANALLLQVEAELLASRRTPANQAMLQHARNSRRALIQ